MAQSESDELPVADIEIDEVRPAEAGFVLQGRGSDGADYRLQVHLDLPVDRQTRAVLAELLSQSEWRIWRRTPTSFRNQTTRSRKRVP